MEVKANGFQSGAIAAASLTYTGVCEVEREMMQQYHYAFTDATSTFLLAHWKNTK